MIYDKMTQRQKKFMILFPENFDVILNEKHISVFKAKILLHF